MEKMFEKLSSYNILNNILPGVIIIYVFEQIYKVDLNIDGILEKLFIYYFVGMIISRLGSLIVEPIAKKVHLVEYTSKEEYQKASKINDKLNILLEANNTYRTLLTLSIVCVFMTGVSLFMFNGGSTSLIIIAISGFVGLVILFAFSYRKQTKHIFESVMITNENQNKTKNA